MTDSKFDPNPRFLNHMCHWQPWADHFKDAPGDFGKLASMFGSALEEIDRLRGRLIDLDKKHAKLLFAFIELVETGCIRPFGEEQSSVGSGWDSIQVLNEWRESNKLNIKEVDVL